MNVQRAKLLTCTVPHGKGVPLLEALARDKSIASANLHHARGLGRSTPGGRRALGESAERDVLFVVVPEERGEEIFEYLYFEGGIGKAHGGFLHMRTLLRSTVFELPADVAPESREPTRLL